MNTVTRELVNEINEYFASRGFRSLRVGAVAMSGGDDTLIAEIYDGDWKHEHLAVEQLVNEFFNNHPTLCIVKRWKENYVGSDGDWYSEDHLWKIGDKSEQPTIKYDDAVISKDNEPFKLQVYENKITEKSGDSKMEPKYLTKEQVTTYLKKAPLNEQLMMEGPLDGLRNKMRDAHREKDIKKSQGGAERIIRDARDPEISGNDTFIVDGKEYKFNDAKGLSDEQLANAIVVDKFGYYRRRALQNVEKKHEFRHSKSQDWIKDEYRYGGKPAEDETTPPTDDKKGKKKKGKEAEETPATPEETLPKMKGDHRDWTFKLKDGRAVDWADLQQIIKEKEIDPAEYKDIVVYDKAKKKFTWEEANKVIDVQMKKYRDDRAARDKKIADKEAAAAKKVADKEAAKEKKAADKADRDETKAAVKKTKSAEKVQRPVGRLKFFDKDGKEVSERQYKKLTTDKKRELIAKDRKGNEFTYTDLLNHRKVQKRLNASLEHDPNKDILESLDWDTVGGSLNENLRRNHRDDKFTESYARAKVDVEYDDDTTSLDYLV